MDRSREEGRLEGDVHPDVDVRGCERRDGDGRCTEERCVPLFGHEPDERAGDLFTAFVAGGQVRQDRDRDDSHVDGDDGSGNRDRESESEQDVDPHPPGAGPQQQIGPTKAEKPERGNNGDDDQDVHRVTAPFAGPAGAGATSGLAAAVRGAGGAPGRRFCARCGRRRARCGRRGVVAVTRLERDRRRAAKGLEVRDHAEDLLIGQANRRPVDSGHPRIESRHDEGVRFVHRLGEVVDIAQARDALRRATGDPREVGEPKRPGLADRVAGPAQALSLRDPAANLHHFGRGEVGADDDLLGRLNFALRHHLADVAIERGGREDESADSGAVRNRHDSPVRPSMSCADRPRISVTALGCAPPSTICPPVCFTPCGDGTRA